MDNWNDLKLVLAIRRAESLTGGAKALGINHSTAFRRLNGLEQNLGVRLFERMPSGAYLVTAAGERVATTAELLETETNSLDRDIVGQDHRLTGQLRVTSSETLAYQVLTRELARFRTAHPGIVVELLVDNRVLNLSRREADIALRVSRPREPELYGRKLSDVAWAIYGTSDIAAAAPTLAAVASAPFIGWSVDASTVASADWVMRTIEPGAIAYRTTSLVNQLTAARAGMGLAVLPCYLGDPAPGLVRALPDPVVALTSELWIVTHADLKRTARIRAFLDTVGEGLIAQKALFAGELAG